MDLVSCLIDFGYEIYCFGNGDNMSNGIRQILGSVHAFTRFLRSEPNFMKKIAVLRKTKHKIVVLGTPIHGNIGDHLIAEAEKQFFTQSFSDYTYIDCTMPFSRYFIQLILKSIQSDDYLMISGGGWLGSEWKTHEVFVRHIISNLKEGHIVILPQTVYYRDYDEFARKGVEIYKKCKNLLFCVRDKRSYEYLLKYGFCELKEVYYMPDFALYYKKCKEHYKRAQTINLCFRDDVEININLEIRKNIDDALRSTGFTTTKVTTNDRGRLVTLDNRTEAISSKIMQIANCKLLITDRLHAMIMAALSGTPCIAFDNSTHKVTGVFEWIKNLNYIHLYEENEDIGAIIQDMLKFDIGNIRCELTDLMPYFDELSKQIRHMR